MPLPNEQGLLQGWNSLLVCPEPLLIKDIKVQVNKQKPSMACPAQLMLIVIKCPLIQRPASLAANPMCVSSEAAFVMRAGLSVGEEEQPSPSNRLHAALL
jgi:hypothetical protein